MRLVESLQDNVVMGRAVGISFVFTRFKSESLVTGGKRKAARYHQKKKDGRIKNIISRWIFRKEGELCSFSPRWSIIHYLCYSYKTE